MERPRAEQPRAGHHADAALPKFGPTQEAGEPKPHSDRIESNEAREWYSAGCAETSRKEYAEGALCFQKALELCPGWHEAQHNLGRVFFELGMIDEALALFRQGSGGTNPELSRNAIAVAIPGSPESGLGAVLDARRAWGQQFRHPPLRSRPRFSHCVNRSHTAPLSGLPLRVGYLSAFFQHDNWMKPVWGLINHHDRRRFQIHLFSDAPRDRIKHGYCGHESDRHYDISGLSNEDAARLIGNSGIDLLVDLNGYSKVSRLPLVALKPAPLIVAWFNMYASSGLDCYDYLVGDQQVIPRAEERFYSEKVVRVPGSYLTFEVNYPVPPVAPPSCLAKGAITFGCLAPQYKITGAAVRAWCAILSEVHGSVLLLRNVALTSLGNRRFVLGLFEKYNISPERVILRGPAPHYRFLRTYDEIDLALDTFPYNGGTTTIEAIWQGVPVVAFWGDRWVSRTSASLLRAGNLGQFVGNSLEDYVSLAIKWGNASDTPSRLAALRHNMRSSLRDSAVCDTAGFARSVERLYMQMIGCQTGQPEGTWQAAGELPWAGS
jgi:protein O-GlcNAc transferase